MTTITVKKLELTESDGHEVAKFTLSILRTAYFTETPISKPIEVESTVEWQCKLCFLHEFAQDEYLCQLPQFGMDDTDTLDYPSWVDVFGNHYETATIEDFINNCDTKEFAAQFIEKYKTMALYGTQIDFRKEMQLVKRSKAIAA